MTTDPDPSSRPPLDPALAVRGVRAALQAVTGHDLDSRVEVVGRTASTSSDLVRAVSADPAGWPHLSVLVADHQAAGRGRAGRSWDTPAGVALTVSVLLRPREVPVERFGWVPLLAGLAVVRAVEQTTGLRPGLKWPNDVLAESVDGVVLPGWGTRRKLAGVLGDLVVTDDGPAVVVGIGVNVSQSADELPVPSATSLAQVAPRVPTREALLGSLVGHLARVVVPWQEARGDAVAAGLAERCAAICTTLGEPVRVELPGGDVLDGTASGIAADGALEVTEASGRVRTVHAGDVRHVRVN
ncbi:biotin--[acetyl-CoA-carboxylase] ligase [Actinotalea sp. K2]|uniref:biotin--[acetyl-CoA-carboxylase] ligase n=1 Tax=Actinotalea sp. K2 TaxID=2939438 RepID=UPI002016E11D|nr:biotin--[acetyl-CoA-carboxylase] ligase [Actinotalea sp. K2]MCL3862432.1 biotin--[acetyl-CoA-carboxylase] ligase [Actinotalea sp. K2]